MISGFKLLAHFHSHTRSSSTILCVQFLTIYLEFPDYSGTPENQTCRNGEKSAEKKLKLSRNFPLNDKPKSSRSFFSITHGNAESLSEKFLNYSVCENICFESWQKKFSIYGKLSFCQYNVKKSLGNKNTQMCINHVDIVIKRVS